MDHRKALLGVCLGVVLVVAFAIRPGNYFLGAEQPESPATTSVRPPPTDGSTVFQGHELSVRAIGETQFTDQTKKVAVETHREHAFGHMVYVTEAGAVAAVQGPSNFEIRWGLHADGSRSTFRFSPYRGTAWRLLFANNRSFWRPLRDSETLPLGDYDIRLLEAKDKGAWIIRINRRTGKTWELVDDEWLAVDESE